MAKAHMTKSYWFESEVDRLIAQGVPNGEALQIILDRLATMDSIEWYEPTNNLTVLSEQEAL